MRTLVLLLIAIGGFVYGASHAPAAPAITHLTMPKSMPKSGPPAMDADDGNAPVARYSATDADPLDSRDWLNDHTAQANVLYVCGLIGQGEYSADRIADGIRRQRIGAASPEALAADREFVSAEMATLRLHPCSEIAELAFARSWSALR